MKRLIELLQKLQSNDTVHIYDAECAIIIAAGCLDVRELKEMSDYFLALRENILEREHDGKHLD